MKCLKGKVAVITGAGSGIGQALAVRLAEEGCSSALVDVRESGLQETARMVEARGVVALSRVLDVADADRVRLFARETFERFGQVDLLINNASVIVVDTVEDIAEADFRRLMEVNFWGVIHCARAFLPYLRQRPESSIVNISSVDGLVGAPNNGPYCAAKFAVTGLTEALAQELVGANVKVCLAVPGGVRTNIHRNALFCKTANPDLCHEDVIECFESMASLSAEDAARIIIRGLRKGKARILVGKDAYVLDFLRRLTPVWTARLVGFFLRRLEPSKARWFGPASAKRAPESPCSPGRE